MICCIVMAHNIIHSFELKPESDGQYKLKSRFEKFTNLPELMSMFKECADIKTADVVYLLCCKNTNEINGFNTAL